MAKPTKITKIAKIGNFDKLDFKVPGGVGVVCTVFLDYWAYIVDCIDRFYPKSLSSQKSPSGVWGICKNSLLVTILHYILK